MICAGIDMGSDTIKIIVSEYLNDKCNVLASSLTKTIGIKKGIIKDKEMVIKSLNQALDDIESQIGKRVTEAIITIPSYDVDINIYSGEIEIHGKIMGEDISNVFKNAIKNNVSKSNEVITVFPIDFTVDEEDRVLNPKGMEGYKLESRVLVSTLPKSFVYTYLEIYNACGIDVIDLSLNPVCDYYHFAQPDFKHKSGVVVNIGSSITEIGIFNKGLMIKNSILDLGSRKVDQDIKYIYHLDKETTKNIKEYFAVASSQYADLNDIIEVETIEKEKKSINQIEISQVVEARLEEILKSVKKEINLLTNHEIGYIIITGGISELAGFNYLSESILGDKTFVRNTTVLGSRSNAYSSVLGLIKYFKEKIELRDLEYTLFKNDFIENKIDAKKKTGFLTENLREKFSKYLGNN